MTTPGSHARRRARPRAPRLAAAIAASAVVALALLAPVAVPAASASPAPGPTPTPTATPPVAPGTTAFVLSPVANGIVRPGESLTAAVTRQNGTDAELPAAEVTLSLGATPLPDRQALAGWLDGTTDGVGVDPVSTAPLDPVAPRSEEVTSISLAPDAAALAGRGPGVYPLVASYPTESGVVTATSAMIVPADDREVGMGVVVPITAGGLTAGLLTADELALLTAQDGGLTAQLDGVDGTGAILAIDPAIPASIRVLGSSAPASAIDWLGRLMALPNSRFALQFGDADVTAQLQAGLTRPLSPTSLTAYLDPADFATATPTPTPTPSPTTTPTPDVETDTGEPTVPDLAQLLSVGDDARAGVYWPAGGTATPDVVAQLGGLTAEDRASLTLIPSTSTAGGSDGSTVAAHGRAGEAAVLVYDTDVSEQLNEASVREKSWLRGAPLTAATAFLAFAAAEADGPLLVSLGRSADRDRVGLSTAIATASTAPGTVPRSLAGLIASEPGQVAIGDAEPEPERAAAASTLLADESALARFATILDDPALLTGPERAEILQLLGVAWVADPAWPTALAEHRAATSATLDSVGLVPASAGDLFGSNASLRFWVRNDLDYPVNLVLYTTPNNLRLDVQRETTVIATAQSNTRVEVPVQARVGSGEVTLALQLRSPAFVAIGPPQTVEVNVWAEWEAVGIAVLAAIVGGLLTIGVVRTVLRIRRRRRRGEPEPGATQAGTPGDGPAPTEEPER
ncbi:DUF6049 family protein [Microbacterium sp. HD4P20]|uniref:DUF6049 family protein n=1 Tax=Microbacterium sp. HD4P20 TaxID=2864874 RepID=UPI0020A584DF|nr:DUF6049 family protein [Microbacterium sp. HD4P20]MCP2638316.1 DUF6049 family protein [Microbacterium sp. HD4P20]